MHTSGTRKNVLRDLTLIRMTVTIILGKGAFLIRSNGRMK